MGAKQLQQKHLLAKLAMNQLPPQLENGSAFMETPPPPIFSAGYAGQWDQKLHGDQAEAALDIS